MNGRRVEHPHNTPEQVREYLTEALTILGQIDPSDDLRAVAFSKAIDLLAAKQITIEAVAMGMPNLTIPKGL